MAFVQQKLGNQSNQGLQKQQKQVLSQHQRNATITVVHNNQMQGMQPMSQNQVNNTAVSNLKQKKSSVKGQRGSSTGQTIEESFQAMPNNVGSSQVGVTHHQKNMTMVNPITQQLKTSNAFIQEKNSRLQQFQTVNSSVPESQLHTITRNANQQMQNSNQQKNTTHNVKSNSKVKSDTQDQDIKQNWQNNKNIAEQNQRLIQQQNMNMHNRGRSSGVVMQQQQNQSKMQAGSMNEEQILSSLYNRVGNTSSSFMQNKVQGTNAKELQQLIDMQLNQLVQAIALPNNQNPNYQLNSTNNSSNQNNPNYPFRRQKQQQKYQQKYQQQLQMYATQSNTNRNIPKNQNSQTLQQQQRVNQQQFEGSQNQQQMNKTSQQAHQQFFNYTNHVRSLSNCSNQYNSQTPGSNQNGQFINQNGNSQIQQFNKGSLVNNQVIGDHRKAPSSINILNQSSASHNINNFNSMIAGIPNIANVNNMGQIAMTHQNLLTQPQISHNLIPRNQTLSEEEKVTEQQILESEEYFESGKLFLTEKKYKDAAKMFTKSFQANKTNYDALFYRAVTNLDQELPEKAIKDLEELMKICSDYRKTMFIVLSIAYRRVNDYLSSIRTLSKAIQLYPLYLEAYIARGQIYSFQKKWDKALNDFKMVLKNQPGNGMGHLGQGDCLKGLGKIEEAIQSYSQVIELDPQSVSQALMKRGLLYLEIRQHKQALKDFNRLTEMAEEQNKDFQSTSLSKAYFYKAKALKKMNNMNDSVLYFEQVLRLGEDNFLQGSALYEIAKIKIQQKDFYDAHYNLQRSSHLNLRYKKLYNYKLFTEGVIFLMKRKTKTGVKLITQVIERMDSAKNQKPQNNIDRPDPASSLSQNEQQQNKNGSQDKFPSNKEEQDYIYPLLYVYRAYGFIVLEEYDKGLKDYLKSSQIKKLNSNQNFNMILCQGLKNLELKEFESSISFFTKASQCQPKKRDPFLLRAMAVIQYTVNKPIKPNTKIQMLKDAKRDLNRALEYSPKDESVLYLRGILNFSLHRFYDAICDFERVIEKSDETNAVYYLARGRCYACLSMFKEAITDLSIAININKDLIDAYLNRGKCAYLIGDTGLAFMDFQKLIVLEPKNSSVHIYAGNLLMTTGSYEDATKAFTNADNIQNSPLALYQRSRCHVALNSMQEALNDLNKVIEISKNDKVAIQDRECLNSLMNCSVQPSVDQNAQNDKQIFLKSAQVLTKLISYEKNDNLAKIIHESSIVHQHSQIIPSAHRTKIDKIRAIRRRKEQDRVQRENPEAGRKNDLRFRVQQNNDQDDGADEYDDISELDDKEIEKLNNKIGRSESNELEQDSSIEDEDERDQDANYYKENIFNKEDFYLYRSIFYIYAGEYEKAVQDLDQCSGIMHQNKTLYPKNQFNDGDLDEGYESPTGTGNVNGINNKENNSNWSSQTDLSDVGLCSLNIHEFSFNTAICLILAKDYKQALEKVNYILQTIAKKYAHQIWLIRGALNSICGHQQQAQKDFKRALKYDFENASKFLQKGEDVYLTIFPQQQRLCSFFQYIQADFNGIKIPNLHLKAQKDLASAPGPLNTKPQIFLKPSFSFPFIKPPNMIPCVDQNLVLENFQLKKSNIQVKPEAPWIKKCQFGIKFTEEILYTDDERDPTPDEEKEYKKRKQRQQERAMEGAGFIRAHSEKVVLRTNIFAEDNNQANAKNENQEEDKEENEDDDDDEDEQNYIYQDEDGNPINIEDLAELGDLQNLAILENMQDLDDKSSLAEQLKLFKRLQKEQNLKIQNEKDKKEQIQNQQHKRNKTQGYTGSGLDKIIKKGKNKGEIDIQEELDLNDDQEYEEMNDFNQMEGLDESGLQESPQNQFNKLQNINNLKDIAKQVAMENDENYEDDLIDDYVEEYEEFNKNYSKKR